MKKEKTIYVITMIPDIVNSDNRSLNRIVGNSRTVSWFPDLIQSQQCVEGNIADIHECCYKYAVIEESLPGPYSICKNEWWYKWNSKKRKYMKLSDKPKLIKYLVNFGIG